MSLRMRLGCMISVTLLSVGLISADSIDLNFNSSAFRAEYALTKEQSGLEFDFGWLHDKEGGEVGSIGLHVLGLAGTQTSPMEAGLGGKIFYVDTDDDSGGALGLGGYLRYRFKRFDRVEASGHLYYAPSTLTISDLESYLDIEARGAFLVHERASIYVGLRLVRVNFEESRGTDVDRGAHIGLRLSF